MGSAPLGHDMPCPWCGHVHHWLVCDDCGCPPHHYPGYKGDEDELRDETGTV